MKRSAPRSPPSPSTTLFRSQAFAARRRLVPGGRADQQIVVEHVAQSLHGPTERRLAEEEPGRGARDAALFRYRSEEHTSELQSRFDLVCRLLLEKKNRRRYD